MTCERSRDPYPCLAGASIDRVEQARQLVEGPEHVNRMLASLANRQPPLSPTTQRYAYKVLRTALGGALKLGKVTRNVATLVDPPVKAKTEMHPLTAAEVRVFLSHVADDWLCSE